MRDLVASQRACPTQLTARVEGASKSAHRLLACTLRTDGHNTVISSLAPADDGTTRHKVNNMFVF